MPRARSAGELHMVAAEQPDRDREHAGHLDETGRQAGQFHGEFLPEDHRARSEHQEPGDHDPGIPGIVGR
jgi:hypothetical protein